MQKSLKMAWLIWFIGSLFYAYQYIMRVMPSIMMPQLVSQFHLNANLFGQYSGVYYLGYALVHLPLGLMLDRLGPRKVMTACIGLSVLGLVPLLLTDSWFIAVFGRFLTGVGSSAAILGSFKIIRMNFSDKQFPRMLSLSVTVGLIGAIYGAGPLNYFIKVVGYHTVISSVIVMGLILAVLTYWVIPDNTDQSSNSIKQDLVNVFSNKSVITMSFLAGLMVGPLEGFADVWGAIYLKNHDGLVPSFAASLPSLIFVGMCFGAPVLNFISEKCKNYYLTIIGAAIAMFVLFVLLLHYNLSVDAIAVFFVIIGVCCAYQVLAIYQISTYVNRELAGLATAVVNMLIMSFGYFFHSTIGFVVSHNGGLYSQDALQYGIAVIPATLVIAVVGMLLFRTKQKNAKEEEGYAYS